MFGPISPSVPVPFFPGLRSHEVEPYLVIHLHVGVDFRPELKCLRPCPNAENQYRTGQHDKRPADSSRPFRPCAHSAAFE